MAVSHGGSIRAACPVTGRTANPAAQPLELYGYRNILGTPQPDQLSRRAPDETLWRLARAMNPSSIDVVSEQNPNLPSGFTYLLQLVAHDCVHTPTPFWQVPPGRVAARNARTAQLRLDTLYGLGPFGTPHAYAPDDPRDVTRTRLRLGEMRPGPVAASPTPVRDIARVAGPKGEGVPGLIDPLICDPRNEDHAILAQMTVLWHMVHNSMVDLARSPLGTGPADHAREAHFIWARSATTLIYRRILRDDLLKRLLHEPVFQHYATAGENDLLDGDPERPGGSVPLEFSHGAMRFAHTMIRPAYRVTDTNEPKLRNAMLQTSARRPAEMPLGADWIIRWSHFFEDVTPKAPANISLLIRPRYIQALMSSDLFSGPAPGHGLAMQDLASAAASPLWSVAALHDEIASQAAGKGWNDPFAGCDLAQPAREAALADWLARHSMSGDPFTQQEIADLAKDPPLPFYIQFEAEHVGRGRRLGPLGSILLAETFFGALLGDPLPGEPPGAGPGPPLDEALLALAGALGVPLGGASLPKDATMGALIRWVADARGLNEATPAFL